MRCPDADAPRVMTTEIPVSGEHVIVFYDPAGNIATRPASEVQASQVRAGIAAVAGAVWAVLLLGLMLLAKPAAGDPEIEPSTGDD
jgi:hypothetical protein